MFYTVEDLRNPSKQSEVIRGHIALGRKLIPQRYVELKPKIEEFDWVI